MPNPCHHPPIPHKPGKNWIERLPVPLNSIPEEAECVARALFWDRGKDEQAAYRIAMGKTEDWAAGKGNVHEDVRMRSRAAVAKWATMRSANTAQKTKKLSEALVERGFEGERLRAALEFATVADVTYQTPIAGFSVGDHVMWPTSQGVARGKIKRLATEGSIRGDGKTTVRAMPEEPVARIEVHRKGKPTGVHVAHKLSRLRKLDAGTREMAERLEAKGMSEGKAGVVALELADGLDSAYVEDLKNKGLPVGICGHWNDLAPDQKERWISAVEGHFGKEAPLKDAYGKPSRHALAARSHGLPVPKSTDDVEAIRELARRRKAAVRG